MDSRFILSPTCPTPEAEGTHPQNQQHTPTTYYYTPLKHPDEIRLLVIDPGRPSEAVKCNLLHTRLSQTPSYEALSYTWGTEERPSQISLGQNGQVSVTKNCFEAIRRLRYTDRQRVIWIDAVCINQPSIVERSHQVAIMPSVYRQANKVIVYLGESTEDSDLAMDYLGSHGFINDDASSWSPSRPQLALGRLISRPWFSRVWVLQEIFMSASAEVVCGEKRVPWACFRRLAKWNPQSSPQRIPLVMSINSHRNTQHPSIHDYFKLLCNTRDCGCKDPRDRIFALFSMGPEDVRKNLSIDYKESPEKIFTNTAIYLINSIGLDALCGVGGRDESSSLPSWVPDWRVPVSSTQILDLVDEVDSAGGKRHDQVFQFFSSPQTRQQTVLQTFGYHFGNVESVGDIFSPDRGNFGDVINQGWEYFSSWHPDVECQVCHGVPGSSCTTTEATTHNDIYGNPKTIPKLQSVVYRETLFRTLYMDAKSTTSWTRKRLWAMRNLPTVLTVDVADSSDRNKRDILSEKMVDTWGELRNEISCESYPFTKQKRLYSCCIGRRLCMVRGFWTAPKKPIIEGVIGVVPSQTQLGDQLFILRGARCPFVLRREHDHFIMIGPCFVWEAMDRRHSSARFQKIEIW